MVQATQHQQNALRVGTLKAGDNRREATAREQLKKLLGD
jgi:hypothetical protein